VIKPLLAQPGQPLTKLAIRRWENASSPRQTALANASGKVWRMRPSPADGGPPRVPLGAYGPVATIMNAQYALARTGALDGTLLHQGNNPPGQFFRFDYTEPLMYLADGNALNTQATAEGLRPLIYTHPIGVYGHAAGPTMDARAVEDAPENTRARGQYPLFLNTAYAIEFSATTSIAEWGNQDVEIGYEEDAVFTAAGCRFIDGHQTSLLLIR